MHHPVGSNAQVRKMLVAGQVREKEELSADKNFKVFFNYVFPLCTPFPLNSFLRPGQVMFVCYQFIVWTINVGYSQDHGRLLEAAVIKKHLEKKSQQL